MASHDGDESHKYRSHHGSEEPSNKYREVDESQRDLLSGGRHRYRHGSKEQNKRDHEVEEKSKRDLLRHHDLEERGRERRPDHKRGHEHEDDRERNRKRRRHHSQTEMERNLHSKPEKEREKERECLRLHDKEREQSLHDREREERRRQERSSRWEQPCAEDINTVACPASSSSSTGHAFDAPKISLSNTKRDRCIVLKNLFDPKSKMEDKFFDNMRNHLHRGSARCGVKPWACLLANGHSRSSR